MRYKEIERWMMTNLSSQKVTNHITSLSLKASRNNRKSGYSLPHRSPSIVLWMAWLNFNNAMKLNYAWNPPFSTSTCRMWRWWFQISRRQPTGVKARLELEEVFHKQRNFGVVYHRTLRDCKHSSYYYVTYGMYDCTY